MTTSEDVAPRGNSGHWWRWGPTLILIAAPLIVMSLVRSGGMRAVSAWYLAQLALPLLGIVILLATLFYAWRRKRWGSRAVLLTLALSILLSATALWTLGLVPIAYPASLAKTTPAVTVRLPSDLPLTVGWGGDSTKTNYHAVTPDQRWAYDLLIEPYLLGSETLTDYGCYGTPVLAPASGTVSYVVDDKPDELPGKVSNNIAAPAGNAVGIRLDETETYLLIAHLRPGSLLVTVGDHVSEGQPIGECGNSGNTSEPHIHIHHQRQDPAEAPIGFAEGLPLYFRDLDGPAMPVGGLTVVDGTPVATGDRVQNVGGQ